MTAIKTDYILLILLIWLPPGQCRTITWSSVIGYCIARKYLIEFESISKYKKNPGRFVQVPDLFSLEAKDLNQLYIPPWSHK